MNLAQPGSMRQSSAVQSRCVSLRASVLCLLWGLSHLPVALAQDNDLSAQQPGGANVVSESPVNTPAQDAPGTDFSSANKDAADANGTGGDTPDDLLFLPTEPAPAVTTTPGPGYILRPDFSGNWQKDFTRSDNWEKELIRLMDQLQRDAQRQGGSSDPGRIAGPLISNSDRRRGARASLVDMARLAEYISRQTTIRIEQSAVEVRVIREGDADLVCSTRQTTTETFSSDSAEEMCGWDAHQLVFRVTLPDVTIVYRLVVSEDRQELNMATTLSSGSSIPYTLRQYYWRYDAPNDQYNCIETISRGNSCRLTDQVQ